MKIAQKKITGVNGLGTLNNNPFNWASSNVVPIPGGSFELRNQAITATTLSEQ